MTDQVSPELMAEMRAQAMECDWRETEESGESVQEFIENQTDEQIIAHYENQPGGVEQFARDSGMDVPE